jgi:hypothetical protein
MPVCIALRRVTSPNPCQAAIAGNDSGGCLCRGPCRTGSYDSRREIGAFAEIQEDSHAAGGLVRPENPAEKKPMASPPFRPGNVSPHAPLAPGWARRAQAQGTPSPQVFDPCRSHWPSSSRAGAGAGCQQRPRYRPRQFKTGGGAASMHPVLIPGTHGDFSKYAIFQKLSILKWRAALPLERRETNWREC